MISPRKKIQLRPINLNKGEKGFVNYNPKYGSAHGTPLRRTTADETGTPNTS